MSDDLKGNQESEQEVFTVKDFVDAVHSQVPWLDRDYCNKFVRVIISAMKLDGDVEDNLRSINTLSSDKLAHIKVVENGMIDITPCYMNRKTFTLRVRVSDKNLSLLNSAPFS